ncbi:HD domain-containing protein [Pullulanibacillus camelliae]|uniref:HD domain-containing protein n=1 Tax=Pullulanibacillus camelliae TaxID=1707096 RepID=UPI00166BA277|nr:HD domain-containing protein [Pullulanibacillus camelliae]
MIQKILEVIHLAERLKKELRHSWLSNGRQESVAEHSWRLALIAVLVEPYLDHPVNLERLLTMSIIHDLVEAIAGDIPAFDTQQNQGLKEKKTHRELAAIETIRSTLPTELGQALYDSWIEFEEKATYEAKVAQAIDKLEAQLQHNEADITSWLDIEYQMVYRLKNHVSFDSFLQAFEQAIREEAEEKMTAARLE